MNSFKLLYFIIFSLYIHLTQTQISDKRLCVDEHCTVPVSQGKTLLRYSSPDSRILSFGPNEDVTIFSKSAGSREDLWGAEIKGKRGYVPKTYIREFKVIKKPDKLVSTEFTNNGTNVENETDKSQQVPLQNQDDNSNIEPNKVQQDYEIVDGTTIPLNPDAITPTATESPMLSTAVPTTTTNVETPMEAIVTSQEKVEQSENKAPISGEGDDDDGEVEDEDDEYDLEDDEEEDEEFEQEQAIVVKNDSVTGEPPAIETNQGSNDSDQIDLKEQVVETAKSQEKPTINFLNSKISENAQKIVDTIKTQESKDENVDSPPTSQASEIAENQQEEDKKIEETPKPVQETEIKVDEKIEPTTSTQSPISEEQQSKVDVVTEENKSEIGENKEAKQEVDDDGNQKQSKGDQVTVEEPNSNQITTDTSKEESELNSSESDELNSTTVSTDDFKVEVTTFTPEIQPPPQPIDILDDLVTTPNPIQDTPSDDIKSDDSFLPSLSPLGGLFGNRIHADSKEDVHSEEAVKETAAEDIAIKVEENDQLLNTSEDLTFDQSSDLSENLKEPNNIIEQQIDVSEESSEIEQNSSEVIDDSPGIFSKITSFLSGGGGSSDDQGTTENIEVAQPDITENINKQTENTARSMAEMIAENINKEQEVTERSTAEVITENINKEREVIETSKEEIVAEKIKMIPQETGDNIADVQEIGDESLPPSAVAPEIESHQHPNLASILTDDFCHVGSDSSQCSKSIKQELNNEETMSFVEIDWTKFNPNIVIYLTTTAISVLTLLFGYIILEKCKREGPLVAKINKLEKELLIVLKENEILKEGSDNKGLLQANLQMNDEEKIILKQEFAELLNVKNALEEQIQSLEKELENSTEVGLELNRMLSEILSSQSGSDVIKANVENLQRQLVEQQSTINSINETLALTNTENHELKLEIELNNKKVIDLQSELDKMCLNLLKIEEEKDLQQNLLENDVIKYKQLYEEIRSQSNKKEDEFQNQIVSLQNHLNRVERDLELRDKEFNILQDNIKTLNSVNCNENTIKSILEVTDIKAELELLKAENKKFIDKLEKEHGAKINIEKQAQAAIEEVHRLREKYDEADKVKVEAQTKLEVLSNYFKDKEAQLQKEITKHESLWVEKQGEATSTTERIQFLNDQMQNYKAQNESLKQEIIAQEVELKSQISVLEKKAHENWVNCRQVERKLEDAKQEAAQLRHRLTLRERAFQEEKGQHRLQSPMEQNGDLPVSPLNVDSSSSPLLFNTREHITKSPPLPGLPPFLPPPPGVPFMPPPPLHGVPPFIPPPPSLFPGDHRPPPLGRMSSPPINSRYSPSSRGYSPYDRNSSSPSDSEYSEYPSSHHHHHHHHHRRAYSPPYNSRGDDRRDYKRHQPIRNNDRSAKGVESSASGHSNESLDRVNRQQSKV